MRKIQWTECSIILYVCRLFDHVRLDENKKKVMMMIHSRM